MPDPNRARALWQGAIGGDRRSLSRAITLLERHDPEILAQLARQSTRRAQHPGAPHVVGLTGPPGAGKSTLTDALIVKSRARGERVAVLAVDPSSPFSGGAILGDRIRMERHTGDDSVYLRSLSSRGHTGGLSTCASQLVDLFDAAGFDRVIVETVGVGQSEIGVMEVADTVVVVLTPESGDSVQAMKAGLLEIADVFAVNKADRPGADRLVRELAQSVSLSEDPGAWRAPVQPVIASQEHAPPGKPDGTEILWENLDRHLAWCMAEGLERWKRRRGEARLRLALDLVAEEAKRSALQRWSSSGLLSRILAGDLPAHEAAYTKLNENEEGA